MKVFRRLFLLSLVLAMVLGVAARVPASAQENVTIRWWHIQTAEAQAAFWQGVADDFMAQHPNVDIEITVLENEAFKARLVTVMQAGDPPDLFQSWGGGVLWKYADAGLVRNIAPELEGEWKDSFAAQAALELYGRDGEYFGVPWTWGAVGIFYNKELFARAGLDPENPPQTWDEFLAAVTTLKEAGITPISLGGKDKWPGHFWWVYLALRVGGGDAFLNAYNREGAFTDEPFVKAGEYLKQLVDLDPFPQGFLGMNYGDQQTAMLDEVAAMELMGQWATGAYQGNSAEKAAVLLPKLGWFPFPVVEGGAGNPGDVLGGGDGFAVGANAPDETVEFLKYITSVEVQSAGTEDPAMGIVPTVEGADEVITDPIKQTIIQFRDEAPYFQLYYDQFLPPAVGGIVNDAVEALFAGVASPQEVAAMIEDSAAMELE